MTSCCWATFAGGKGQVFPGKGLCSGIPQQLTLSYFVSHSLWFVFSSILIFSRLWSNKVSVDHVSVISRRQNVPQNNNGERAHLTNWEPDICRSSDFIKSIVTFNRLCSFSLHQQVRWKHILLTVTACLWHSNTKHFVAKDENLQLYKVKKIPSTRHCSFGPILIKQE